MVNLRSVSTVFFLVFIIRDAVGQQCSYFSRFSKTEKDVIINYIGDSKNKNFIRNGKGVVHISMSHGQSGKRQWYITTHIDDQFIDFLPSMWTMIGNELVFISNESTHNGFKSDSLLAAHKLCLKDISAGRVYRRPTQKRKAVVVDFRGEVVFESEGKPKMNEIESPLIAGNLYNDLVVAFEPDGTFTLKTPL